MSLFKSRGVILKKGFLGEAKEDLFTLFSDYYGKIQAVKKTSKKEKSLDIGYLVDFEIETSEKTQINKIKNIKILGEFNYVDKDFNIINTYLEIINLVLKNTPNGVAIKSLFETLEYIIKYENIDYQKLVLTKLKLLNILGILNLHNENLTIQKILNFIDRNSISKIFLLKQLDNNLLEGLYTIK